MRFGVLTLQVVRVVRRDDAEAELPSQAQHSLAHDSLLGNAVLLDLEPETVRSEQAREPLRAPLGLVVLALPQVERDLTREARRETDDALGVTLQRFPVDSRATIESFRVTDRGQPHEVLVAGPVGCQEYEVAVRGGSP